MPTPKMQPEAAPKTPAWLLNQVGAVTQAQIPEQGFNIKQSHTQPNYECVNCAAPPTCRGKAPGQNCPSN